MVSIIFYNRAVTEMVNIRSKNPFSTFGNWDTINLTKIIKFHTIGYNIIISDCSVILPSGVEPKLFSSHRTFGKLMFLHKTISHFSEKKSLSHLIQHHSEFHAYIGTIEVEFYTFIHFGNSIPLILFLHS